MTAQDFLSFAQARRAALLDQIGDMQAEVSTCDEAIAALTQVDPVEPVPVDPAPVEPDPVDPAPVDPPVPDPGPGPVPAPVPGGPGVRTVAELMTALGNAKSGNTIPIEGKFPAVSLGGIKFSGRKVTLKGVGAEIERMVLAGCTGLRLESLKFVPAGAVVATSKAKPYLLTADAASADIDVNDCDFWGAQDAPAFMSWSLAKWSTQKIGGAFLQGARSTLCNSYALGTHFGFNLTGRDGIMENLSVCGFSGDAFRVCSSGLRAKTLWATDAYVIDGNHPDAFQGFDHSGTLSDQVIEDAIVMEYSTPTDQRGAIGASLQVIGYHDGPYADITYRRIVAASSSQNAYHVNSCPTHIGEKIMMWTVPGPKSGASRIRVPAASKVSDVFVDKTASGSAPATGSPDYAKLAAFQKPALRGNRMPDLRAIMGW